LRLYLQIASEHAVTITQFWRILNLQDWLINAQIAGRDELLKMCGNIINKESWREMILKFLTALMTNVFSMHMMQQETEYGYIGTDF